MSLVLSPLLCHGFAAPAAAGPCDLYAAGGTPCVAAHSTVRALYSGFAGALYQVLRNSDNRTMDVKVLGPGGFADSQAQDAFCGSRAQFSRTQPSAASLAH